MRFNEDSTANRKEGMEGSQLPGGWVRLKE